MVLPSVQMRNTAYQHAGCITATDWRGAQALTHWFKKQLLS